VIQLFQVLAARRLHFKAVTAACVAHTKRMRGEALASPSKADAKHLANSYTVNTARDPTPSLAIRPPLRCARTDSLLTTREVRWTRAPTPCWPCR
jgi:hypothetical protein